MKVNGRLKKGQMVWSDYTMSEPSWLSQQKCVKQYRQPIDMNFFSVLLPVLYLKNAAKEYIPKTCVLY